MLHSHYAEQTSLATVSWLLFPDRDPLVCGATHLCLVPRQNSTFGDRSFATASLERAAIQPTRHWAIAVYLQRTFEDLLILCPV